MSITEKGGRTAKSRMAAAGIAQHAMRLITVVTAVIG